MNCSFSKEEVWFPELLKNPDSTELLQKFKEPSVSGSFSAYSFINEPSTHILV